MHVLITDLGYNMLDCIKQTNRYFTTGLKTYAQSWKDVEWKAAMVSFAQTALPVIVGIVLFFGLVIYQLSVTMNAYAKILLEYPILIVLTVIGTVIVSGVPALYSAVLIKTCAKKL